MHTGPVDGVLPGHPRKKPLPGHAVVPALLPDVQGLLCKQDAPAASAIAELMTRGPAAPQHKHAGEQTVPPWSQLVPAVSH